MAKANYKRLQREFLNPLEPSYWHFPDPSSHNLPPWDNIPSQLRPAGKARGINWRKIYKPMKIFNKISSQDALHALIEISVSITHRLFKNSLEIITPLIYTRRYIP